MIKAGWKIEKNSSDIFYSYWSLPFDDKPLPDSGAFFW